MPNFVFSIAIHHYIFALRDLILAKNHFMPDQPSSLTNVLRFEAQNKESGGGLADRLDRRWVLRRERGRIHIRTREKVQTLASERESGWFPATAQRHLSLPPRFTSFLFSSLKHHFADGCIACIIMGSKESLPQNAASQEDRALEQNATLLLGQTYLTSRRHAVACL